MRTFRWNHLLLSGCLIISASASFASGAQPLAGEIPLEKQEFSLHPKPEFALGPGDKLQVTVWGYPELSSEVVILPDGMVSYPLVGLIPAGGLTARDFAEKVRGALEQHIESPRVHVTVSQMNSRRYSVLGEVNRAGVFPLWDDSTDVLEAIAQAGGMGNAALPSEVRIVRHQPGKPEELIPINMNSLLDSSTPRERVILQPGDVVYVPSQVTRRKICVLGEVNAPGLYTMTPHMTVIEALSVAGWVRPSGILKSVMVVRHDPKGGRQFFRIDAQRAVVKQDWAQHLMLQPGDIVYVPERMFAKIGNFVGFFTTNVEPAARAYLKVYDAADPSSFLVER